MLCSCLAAEWGVESAQCTVRLQALLYYAHTDFMCYCFRLFTRTGSETLPGVPATIHANIYQGIAHVTGCAHSKFGCIVVTAHSMGTPILAHIRTSMRTGATARVFVRMLRIIMPIIGPVCRVVTAAVVVVELPLELPLERACASDK